MINLYAIALKLLPHRKGDCALLRQQKEWRREEMVIRMQKYLSKIYS